jgi:hypothetical protein
MLSDVPRIQQNLESRLPRLSILRSNSIRFKAEFVDEFTPSSTNENFERFRNTYINLIREVLINLFFRILFI